MVSPCGRTATACSGAARRGRRLGFRYSRSGSEDAREGARTTGAGWACGDDDAWRAGRRVPRDASGGAGDDREAVLAARQGHESSRSVSAGRPLAEGSLCVAADHPAGHRFEATQTLHQVLNRPSAALPSRSLSRRLQQRSSHVSWTISGRRQGVPERTVWSMLPRGALIRRRGDP